MRKIFYIIFFCTVLFAELSIAQNWQWGGMYFGSITTSNDQIFVSSYPLGLLKSSDNGSSWTNLGLLNKDIRQIAISPNGKIFVPTAGDGGIFVSSDSGKTWIEKNNGVGKVAARVIKANSSGHLYLGTWLNGIYKSTDDGDNWTKVSNAIDIFDILIDSTGKIFVASALGIYRSTDDGATWSLENTGLNYTSMVSISQNNKGDLIASTWNVGHIYKSTNNGDSWQKMNMSDKVKYAADIVYDNNKGFAATDSGIFVSQDDFNTWTSLTPSIPGVYVYAQGLGISANGYLFATFASGAFLRTIKPTPEIIVSQVYQNSLPLEPVSFKLRQNYPNPFNPSTKIDFELPGKANVQINIYNEIGQIIKSFEPEEKDAGSYSLVWDGKDNFGKTVSSGSYFYQVKAGENAQTKKMLFLK